MSKINLKDIAAQVPGVRRIFLSKDGTGLYIEAFKETSVDGKGTPSQQTIEEVKRLVQGLKGFN